MEESLREVKYEPTERSLHAYCIARAKTHRNIRKSKKSSCRNHVSRLSSQTSFKSAWNRNHKNEGTPHPPVIQFIIYLPIIEMSHTIVTLQCIGSKHFTVLLLLSVQMPLHLFEKIDVSRGRILSVTSHTHTHTFRQWATDKGFRCSKSVRRWHSIYVILGG